MDDHRSPIFVPPVLLPPSPQNRDPDRAAELRRAELRRGETVFVAPTQADEAGEDAAPDFVAPMGGGAAPIGEYPATMPVIEPAPPRPRVGWIVAPVPREAGPAPIRVVAPLLETDRAAAPVPEMLPEMRPEMLPPYREPMAVVAQPAVAIPLDDRSAGAQARIVSPPEALLADDRMDDRFDDRLDAPVADEVLPPDDERAAPEARVTRVVEAPAPAVRRSRRWLFWLLLLVLVIGVGVWLATRPASKATHKGRFQSAAALPVGTATVATGNMPVTLSALGTVTPLATVTVQTQIDGQLISVGFQEGQIVKKGDFLAQIDPRPYQVALEQAQGTLAKDQASLRDAQVDLARYRKLVAQNSIATQTLDTQVYLVQQDQGTVLADQAAVDTQKLNLVYCRITAPVSGLVGLRLVDPGNYVQTTSTTGIVVITQLQPMSVLFNLPQTDLPEVLQRTQAGVKLPVTAYDGTGTVKLATGVFSTFDNQINTTTGTIEGRAIFPNTKFDLFPNQFVNTDLLVNTLNNVDIVPTSAIERGSPGTYVYVVQANKTVAVQAVKLGPADGQRQAILSGLKPGQIVVTDGADRLKAGDKVTLAAAAKPAAADSAATTPATTAPAATTPAATAPAAAPAPAATPGASGSALQNVPPAPVAPGAAPPAAPSAASGGGSAK